MNQKMETVDLTGINWSDIPVFETQPIYLAGNSEIKGQHAIVDTMTQEVVSIKSEKYVLVQHGEILTNVYEVMKSTGLKVEKVNPQFLNGKMFCDITFKKHEIEVKKDDIIQTGIRVVNSVNGSTGIVVMPFTLRLKCTNGMTHRSILEKSIQYHWGNKMKLLSELESIIKMSTDSIVSIEEQYKHMMETHFSMKVLDMPQFEELALPKRYVSAIEEAHPKTQWDFFNVLTALNTHDTRRNVMSKHVFDGKIEQLLAIEVK